MLEALNIDAHGDRTCQREILRLKWKHRLGAQRLSYLRVDEKGNFLSLFTLPRLDLKHLSVPDK